MLERVLRSRTTSSIFAKLALEKDEPHSRLAAVGYTLIGAATAGVIIKLISVIAKRSTSKTATPVDSSSGSSEPVSSRS